MTEATHEEVGEVGNGSGSITPNTTVSIVLVISIIGAALWIGNGQTRLEARAARLEELVVDLRNTVAATAQANERTADKLADHEAWARSEAVRLRMAMNEERRKAGLPQIEGNPYLEASGQSRRRE